MVEIASSTKCGIAAVEGGHFGQRPWWPPATASDLGLFGDLERIVNLDAKVLHSRFQLGVAE